MRGRRGKGTPMAKYKVHYENGNAEDVEADKFLDPKETPEWIDFYQGTGGASRRVLRVKASKVWKIELLR
jgi:hypothetical protein